MNTMFSNGNLAGGNWNRYSLFLIMGIALLSSCNTTENPAGGGAGGSGAGGSGGGDGSDGSGGDDGTDGLIDAKIFDVDMQVDSWDTSDDSTPQFSSVASMLFGTFPLDPLAVAYTVEYIDPDHPALEATASWDARNIAGIRESVPDVFAVSAGVVPGYVDGVVGGEYFIRVTGSGCQSGASGECRLGTESTLATESLLKDVRMSGTLRITIEYE